MTKLRRRLRDHTWRHDVELIGTAALIAIAALAGLAAR
jgi:hypothetical protein